MARPLEGDRRVLTLPGEIAEHVLGVHQLGRSLQLRPLAEVDPHQHHFGRRRAHEAADRILELAGAHPELRQRQPREEVALDQAAEVGGRAVDQADEPRLGGLQLQPALRAAPAGQQGVDLGQQLGKEAHRRQNLLARREAHRPLRTVAEAALQLVRIDRLAAHRRASACGR